MAEVDEMLKWSYTRHAFGRREVLEFNTRVQENTRPHNLTTSTDEQSHPTTHQQGCRSDLILETRSHPWVVAGHPQYTGAWFAREAVDGPQPNHCAHAAVSEKHLHSCIFT